MSPSLRPLLPLTAVVGVHLAAAALFLAGRAEPRPPQEPAPLLATLLAPESAPQPLPAIAAKPVHQPAPRMPRATTVSRPQPAPVPARSEALAAQAARPTTAPAAGPAAPAAAPVTTPAATAHPALEEPSVDASLAGNEKPRYPPISRQLGEQGTVMLSVFVRADGSVGDIRLKASSQYERLDQAALEKVRQWHFTPAKRAGVAVDRWYDLPIRFQLNR